MSPNNTRRLQRSRLSAALLAVLITPVAGAALAQDADNSGQADPKNLDTVTVTGSRIPVTEIETFTPVTEEAADDIQMRGFLSIADDLHPSTLASPVLLAVR